MKKIRLLQNWPGNIMRKMLIKRNARLIILSSVYAPKCFGQFQSLTFLRRRYSTDYPVNPCSYSHSGLLNVEAIQG